MPEEMLVRHCSPTLAGLKPGSLFSCVCTAPAQLREEICQMNHKLVPKGLRVLPMRWMNGRALIYVYRPRDLATKLQNTAAAGILAKCGYPETRVESCICRLRSRFQKGEEFPHEVGLFLGYPPEDVEGFISQKAQNYKCVGCWKVYGDAEAAQRTFEKYKKCTDVYCSQWEKGISIERLTVAC